MLWVSGLRKRRNAESESTRPQPNAYTLQQHEMMPRTEFFIHAVCTCIPAHCVCSVQILGVDLKGPQNSLQLGPYAKQQ